MLIEEFVAIPIYGPGDDTVKISKRSIIDVRVINLGRRQDQPGRSSNWMVQVNVLLGKYYLLRTEGAPYATKEEALLVRDEFLGNIND
jgi:hypothetical protein